MKNQQSINPLVLSSEIKQKLVTVRGQLSLLDRDVAALYGVETRVINQAVKNNPEKFPAGYVLELSSEELSHLRSKFLTANVSSKSRALPKVFTERGLYMLATILKGEQAVRTTLAIIETYAQVRAMVRDMEALQTLKDGSVEQATKLTQAAVRISSRAFRQDLPKSLADSARRPTITGRIERKESDEVSIGCAADA